MYHILTTWAQFVNVASMTVTSSLPQAASTALSHDVVPEFSFCRSSTSFSAAVTLSVSSLSVTLCSTTMSLRSISSVQTSFWGSSSRPPPSDCVLGFGIWALSAQLSAAWIKTWLFPLSSLALQKQQSIRTRKKAKRFMIACLVVGALFVAQLYIAIRFYTILSRLWERTPVG